MAKMTAVYDEVIAAGNVATDVCHVLTVLQMAIAREAGGLDEAERAGIENVILHAGDLAIDLRRKISAASRIIEQSH